MFTNVTARYRKFTQYYLYKNDHTVIFIARRPFNSFVRGSKHNILRYEGHYLLNV